MISVRSSPWSPLQCTDEKFDDNNKKSSGWQNYLPKKVEHIANFVVVTSRSQRVRRLGSSQ